jgi:hypothetical protein
MFGLLLNSYFYETQFAVRLQLVRPKLEISFYNAIRDTLVLLRIDIT